ncbi:hypothetical protein ACFL20_02415 [Spirochaetota bacterium]
MSDSTVFIIVLVAGCIGYYVITAMRYSKKHNVGFGKALWKQIKKVDRYNRGRNRNDSDYYD